MIKNLEDSYQNGGGDNLSSPQETENMSDEKTMNHIKNIILKELDNLKDYNADQLGGDCGCDKNKQQGGNNNKYNDDSSSSTSSSSSSSIVEHGKNKKSKSKKSKSNKFKESTSNFFIETSESGKDKESSSSNKIETSNDEDEEEGLSIFPFNSSDVKSSISVKNYRMLRRKI